MGAQVNTLVIILALVPLCLCRRREDLEYAYPPPCDTSKIPSLGQLDLTRMTGIWYKRYASGAKPPFLNTTGFQYDIGTNITEDWNRLDMHMVTTSSDNDDCAYTHLTCPVINSTCYADYHEHFFNVFAIDYESVLASWSLTIVDELIYPIFTITVRDPKNPPDLTPIQDAIRDFCGEQALDLDSDFYWVKHAYDMDNFDKCFEKSSTESSD